jgi:hypothetical protein
VGSFVRERIQGTSEGAVCCRLPFRDAPHSLGPPAAQLPRRPIRIVLGVPLPASRASDQQPVVPPPILTLVRALPSLVVLGVTGLITLCGVYRFAWSVFAVVFAYILQALAAGVLAHQRAKRAAGPTTRPKDDTLVSEFFKTYITILLVLSLISSMVFGGRLFRPGGEAPKGVYAALVTWQYWAVVGLLVAAEVVVFLIDRARGAGRDLPPETFVSEPLRRLFVLQGAAFILGLVVYWTGSSQTGIAAIVIVETAGVVLMAALARLREARVRAALEAGAAVKPVRLAKTQPRAGRKRARKR